MPTNFASKAIAPRMRSARARSVSSASGSAKGLLPCRIIEPGLQDELGGDFVAHGLALACANACRGKRAFRILRRVTLVHSRHVETEAALQLPRETLGPRRHLVRRSIGMQGPSDDQNVWLPLGDQCS